MCGEKSRVAVLPKFTSQHRSTKVQSVDNQKQQSTASTSSRIARFRSYIMSTSIGEKRQNGDAVPPAAPAAPQPSNDKAARRKRFEDVFPVIVDELTGYLQAESMPKDAVEWYKNVSGVRSASAPASEDRTTRGS